jgi:hypothetical protein
MSVTYPTHMTNAHAEWLSSDDADHVTKSMVDLVNAAHANSGNPYYNDSGSTIKVAFDPDTRLAAMATQLSSFSTHLGNIDPDGNIDTYLGAVADAIDAEVIDSTYVTNDIASFAAVLDDQIETVVLPKFQAGLRDVNAVCSSAFMIGEAILWGMRDRDVAKYGTDLRTKLAIQRADAVYQLTKQIMNMDISIADLYRTLLHYKVEIERMGIAAQKEEHDASMAIDVAYEKWNFDVYTYAANLLGAIGAGTYLPNVSDSGPSTTQSAIGGALAGAALGMSVSDNWQGAAIGAALGVGASFL